MNFYRKKPVIFQALCYDGLNGLDVMSFLDITEDSVLFPSVGEYVVRLGDGSFEIFTSVAFNVLFEQA
tara:strand:- start:908 stop:1111 length:204 start_codon:yes stop_codon:yes gene_type:complete